MTAASPQFFEPVPLSTSATKLFTLPSADTGTTAQTVRLRFTNTTTLPITVTAYAVPAGQVAGPINMVASAVAIGGSDYLDIDMPVLAPGDFYSALASSSGIVASQLAGTLVS